MDDLKNFFKAFVMHLDENIAYDTVFFNKEYNIKNNVSSYHLKKAAYNGEICMIKTKSHTYFIHRKYYNMFKPFEKLNHVKVI